MPAALDVPNFRLSRNPISAIGVVFQPATLVVTRFPPLFVVFRPTALDENCCHLRRNACRFM